MYLSHTLWEYRSLGEFTDLTLVCADGTLATHAAMIAGLFTSYDLNFSSKEEVPDLLLLPDLTLKEVKYALQKIYLQNNLSQEVLANKPLKQDGEKSTNNDINKLHISEKIKLEEPSDKSLETYVFNTVNMNSHDRFPETTSVKNILLCNLCKKKFERGQDYRKHKYIVHGEAEEKVWADWEEKKRGLDSHIKQNTDPLAWLRSKKCKYCESESKQKRPYNIKWHYAMQHRDQLNLDHSDIEFKVPCTSCDHFFLGKHDMNKHCRKEHGKPWKCMECEEEYPTKYLQLIHRKSKHANELAAKGVPNGKKDQKCLYCSKQFEKQMGRYRCRPTVEKHIFMAHKDQLKHHPELTAEVCCDECGKEFYDSKTHKLHKTYKHGDTLKCTVCYKVLQNKDSLKVHMDSHAEEVHVCEICKKEKTSLRYLKEHMARMHLETPKEGKFPCKLCWFKRAGSEESLQTHMLRCHSGIKHTCSKCPKTFRLKVHRRAHEKAVHDDKTEKCKYCGKMYSSENLLKRHIDLVHKGVNKIKDKMCPHCSETFAYSTSFKAHVLRHNNDRQFPCDICGKAFILLSHLENHMKFHTLPHKCDECEKAFNSKTILKDHINMKHAGLKQECRYNCGYDAWYRAVVMKHEKFCSLNPLPGSPYTVAMGTASSFTIQKYRESLKENTVFRKEIH